MQAQPSRAYHPPTGTLGELTRASRDRAAALRTSLDVFRDRARDRPRYEFAASLAGDLTVSLGVASEVAPSVSVIAEVKRASPSKGAIAPTLDAAAQARAYADGGARAISVLTEPTRFAGTIADLNAAASAVAVPVIRKDFIVDVVQLWEARAYGASAVLLIVKALDDHDLQTLSAAATGAELELLFEVRDEWELERAIAVGARVIGVNSRNLETLVIDSDTVPRVLPRIPADRIRVAESGLRTREDVERASAIGADAVLIGSAVSAAADPEAAVRSLVGVPRAARVR